MTNEELFVAAATKTWTTVINRTENILSSLSDDELQLEVSPGRNRVYYILGHLAAVHDALLPLLGLGERQHPELDDLFIANPDRTFPDEISGAELRKIFTEANKRVTDAVAQTAPTDLLKKHEAVSAEDFAKEPLRNRLSVFENRTAHAMFHAGQIRLVSKP